MEKTTVIIKILVVILTVYFNAIFLKNKSNMTGHKYNANAETTLVENPASFSSLCDRSLGRVASELLPTLLFLIHVDATLKCSMPNTLYNLPHFRLVVFLFTLMNVFSYKLFYYDSFIDYLNFFRKVINISSTL